ncbi:serine hydrolase [Trinickia soli]|uniref:Serine hydrolase n=1 Tax=Trinickia soli TaxID=380675 RepID=A0A2N7WA34_9BURK|nr:serine hydrolase [Trinickia soli]PMS26270.1 serine hydrolase [Trinickia soli]CAB3679380.1 Putative D-alanyl-D-alanine carboxypeptidase [Trinickia soli]
MEPAQSLRRRAIAALSVIAVSAPLMMAFMSHLARGAEIDMASRDALAHIVEGEVAAGRIPGAVIVAGDDQGVRYRAAFGYRSIEPVREPMSVDTEFDLASLTKVIATTTAIMQLAEAHRIDLDEPVARYWPSFAANGKGAVTVAQLLTHTSGLAPDLPLGAKAQTRRGVLAEVIDARLHAVPGERVIYSDINFVVLGELVRRITHRSLAGYCRQRIFAPLGMRDTAFLPDAAHAQRAAPTTADTRGMRNGRVHDPTAARMGGVSGNAGLFSTADDLARFARMMLNGGSFEGRRILQPHTIAAMAAAASPLATSPWRGLGWALDAPLVANRDRLPPVGSLYHTGYTGTAIWIDLVSRQFLIVLTNRVHPDDRGDARPLREQAVSWLASHNKTWSTDELSQALPSIEPAVAAALRLPTSVGPVQSGIDVLEALGFAPLAGLRVGLVTNRTGFDSAGRRTIDVIAHAPRVRLAAIFAPEHGLATDRDAPIGDMRDAATGIAVYSLHGATRHFDAAILQHIDALVFDLQDAGVRFFTYETTLGYALEAAAANHIPLFVLDRPDPLGADRVGGPMLDPGHESFTGYFPLPLQPGMTMGELASLFNRERAIGADLRVIAMQRYVRSMGYVDTGLAWTPPSPNLRTLSQLDLYPDVALIEGANVSVGRGTAHPFEWIGAPWIDAVALADALNAQSAGAHFAPVDFVPTESTYRGVQCHGVSIVRDSGSTSVGRLGIALLMALHTLYPSQFDMAATRDSVGSAEVWRAIADGADIRAIEEIEARQLAPFSVLRQRYLSY